MNWSTGSITNLFKSKIANAFILVFLFTIFSLSYTKNVVMPQNGWWHYFAWRINEGDILYKDLYLYIPPYFALITSLLYKIFSNNFMLYTIFVGYPIKIGCILLMYIALCKVTKPFFACLAVLLGAVIGSSYLMDVWYDYNPVLILPSLLIAYYMMLYYENKDTIKNRCVSLIIIGILIGFLLMSKQSLGLAMLISVIMMQLILIHKEKLKNNIKIFICFLFGITVGVLPAILYFSVNNCWQDFILCMKLATGAKGGINGLLLHLRNILSSKICWLIVIGISILISNATMISKRVSCKNFNKCFIGFFVSIFSVFLISILSSYIEFKPILIITYLSETYKFYAILALIWGLIYLYENKIDVIPNYIYMFIYIIILGIILAWGQLSGDYHKYIYEFYSVFSMRRFEIEIFSYLFIVIWIKYMYKYFIVNSREQASVLMFMTIIVTHFFANVISSDRFEELFMLLYIPWGIVYILNAKINIKDVLMYIIIIINIMFSISAKMSIPYDWQGWRTLPCSKSDIDTKISGLNGYKLNIETDRQFSRIVELIENNTAKDDYVYQFANIPLFNVLTNRKIPTYAPISWFDVLPDTIARDSAKKLYANPPKMVIWHNMSDSEWNLLENVFRNGKRSGQRDIKRFYDENIVNNYELLYSIYNHRDGEIEVWLRKEY